MQALILYSENQNLTASAKSVGFVHQTVRNLLNRYLDGGLQALLADNRGGRRRAYMTQEEEEQFLNEQLSSALKGELVRLILFWQPIRQKLVEKRLEKDYTLS
ncbi:helix-turn-helix domain-containing protein [Streptococcus suis]|uniref:Helix-turn-helix domain-containing protein n=1 Tax=Streptococcus suis TaxID=1307 RepID=A0A3R8S810_STRSU|nr:helix-turn-helix domain-containing protein [Streptococcus suis]